MIHIQADRVMRTFLRALILLSIGLSALSVMQSGWSLFGVAFARTAFVGAQAIEAGRSYSLAPRLADSVRGLEFNGDGWLDDGANLHDSTPASAFDSYVGPRYGTGQAESLTQASHESMRVSAVPAGFETDGAESTGSECKQTVLLQMAFASQGVVAVAVSRRADDPENVLFTTGMRFGRPLIGADISIVASFDMRVILEISRAEFSMVVDGQSRQYPLVDTLYNRNNGLEVVTARMPVSDFLILAGQAQPVSGRVEAKTDRLYADLEYAKEYFEILANEFAQVCL
jgi:hypothetical protein